MDFGKDWTVFAVDSETHEFGTGRIVRAHNQLREEAHRLRTKLRRIRDRLKFAANSEGGMVAEIDEVIPEDPKNPTGD